MPASVSSNRLLLVPVLLLMLVSCGSDGEAATPSIPGSATSGSPTTDSPTTGPPVAETTVATTDPIDEDDRAAALTTAGTFGVSVGVPEGSESLIVTEPMIFATTAQDGRIFMQRSTTSSDGGTDGIVLVWSPESNALEELDPPPPTGATADDSIQLHDVATIDGAVTLLYETRPSRCVDPNECIGTALAWQPDTGETFDVGRRNVFEGGWSSLELADNGLIVGTQYESAATGIFLASIGDQEPPTAAALGLEANYIDCSLCPFAYTIDPSGRFVGWADSGGTGVAVSDRQNATEIVVVDLSRQNGSAGGFDSRRVAADVSPGVGTLDIADVGFAASEGFDGGQALFSSSEANNDSQPRLLVKVDLVSGATSQIDAISASLNELDR